MPNSGKRSRLSYTSCEILLLSKASAHFGMRTELINILKLIFAAFVCCKFIFSYQFYVLVDRFLTAES